MDIERLKELIQSEDSDLWDYKEELLALIDEALQAYRPTIPKTETIGCDDLYSQCGECGQIYLENRGYDYCPNCGRRLED